MQHLVYHCVYWAKQLQRQIAKLPIHSTKSIRLFTHLLNTHQKALFLVSIKSNLIIKVYFVLGKKKKPGFSNSLLLCNSWFTCLQYCVGGGRKPRHSEQNVKSREIFRQQINCENDLNLLSEQSFVEKHKCRHFNI